MQPWSLGRSMLRKGFNGAVPELQLNHRSAPQARAWGREQWGCTRCQAHPCPLLAVPCGLGRSGRRALHRAVLVLRMGTGSGIPCMRLRSAGRQWGCPVKIWTEGSHLEPPHTTPCSAECVGPPALVLGLHGAAHHPQVLLEKWLHALGHEPRWCWGSCPPRRAGLPPARAIPAAAHPAVGSGICGVLAKGPQGSGSWVCCWLGPGLLRAPCVWLENQDHCAPSS